jgi:NAD(P)-dependent dehydrogenase (short-subunit alcohol dehydrogenase family)
LELGLKAKSVLVLASNAGFGKAPALEFAREGANILADTGMMRTY